MTTTLSRWVVLALVVVGSTNGAPVPAIGPLPIYTVLLAVAVVLLALQIASGRVPARPSPVVLLFGLAVASMVPSVFVAQDGVLAGEAMTELAKEFLFFVVFVYLATSSVAPAALGRALAGVMGVLGALATIDQFLLGNSTTFGGLSVVSVSEGVGTSLPRLAGPFDDPNFFGRLLTLAFPLTIAFAALAWRRRERLAVLTWVAAALGVVGGVYCTGSRGAMLGSMLAAGLWMFLASPRTRRALILAPVAVGVLLLVPGVGSRLMTLDTHAADSQSFAEEDGSIVERAAVVRVVASIFEHHLILGVGPGNLATDRLPDVTAGGGAIKRDAAPHNTYLQLGAESGIIGLLGWLVFLFGVIAMAVRVVVTEAGRQGAATIRGPDRAASSDVRIVAAGGAAAVVGWMFTSIFLHIEFLRPLLVVVAMIGLLSRRVPSESTEAGPALARPSPRAMLGAAVFVTVLLLIVAVVPLLRTRVWTAEVPLAITASGSAGHRPDAYRVSLTSRRVVVATYAAVVRQIARDNLGSDFDNAQVTVVPQYSATGTSLTPTFVIQVTDPDRSVASHLARQLARQGSDYISRTPQLASFATTDEGPVRTTPTTAWRSLPGS